VIAGGSGLAPEPPTAEGRAMHEPHPRRPGETVFAVFLLLVSLVVLQQGYAIAGFSSPSSAGVFPMLAGATMAGAMIAVLWRRYRSGSPAAIGIAASKGRLARFGREILPLSVVVFIGLIITYMLALERVGFLIASLVFLFLSIWLLYRRNPLLVLAVSVGALAGIYIVFRHIFTVLLP
jgi:putative tricarboxylic transport membrane protein